MERKGGALSWIGSRHVGLVSAWLIALDAKGGGAQAVRVHIHQADPWGRDRKPAAVQKPPSAHPHIQVLGSDVPVVESKQLSFGAAPHETVGHPQYQPVVGREQQRRIRRLARLGKIGSLAHGGDRRISELPKGRSS